jgi:lipoate-protein ligase A
VDAVPPAVTEVGGAWRLLITEPADGATNMAIDEAIWRGRRAGASPPTLRFFAWAPPTVSLGYGQPLDDHVDVAACHALGVGLVRRPTGGSAIYHDGAERELTYSVAATAGDLGVGADLLLTCQWIGRALRRGLRALGAAAELVATRAPEGLSPAFCFARTGTWEIEIDGRKVVGSAQRRQGAAFLQHGSVLLGVDEPRLRALFPRTRNPLATLTTLDAALGRRPSFDEVAHALAEAFEREHGLRLKPDGLWSDELRAIDTLVREKYGSDIWLHGGPRRAPQAPQRSERPGGAGTPLEFARARAPLE